MTEPKKPRKTRKDKGKKRGKRTIKNPRLQTGSLDFRHIGTTVTKGQNLTALAGLLASSRPAFPTFSQDQQLIDELRKKEEQIKEEKVKNTELVIRQQNIPPQPSFEPDVEQGQEENATQVRKAMGERIGRLRKEEAALEAKNKLISEELQKNSQKLIEQEGFITKQKEDLIKGVNYLPKQGLIRALNEQGIKTESNDDLTDLRISYLRSKGLRLDEDYTLSTRAGARGKASKEFDLIPIPKQDLQRAQEERAAAEIPELKRSSSQEEREKRFTQVNLLEEGNLSENELEELEQADY